MNFLLTLYPCMEFGICGNQTLCWQTCFCSPAAPCVNVLWAQLQRRSGRGRGTTHLNFRSYYKMVHLERLSSPTARNKLPQLMRMGDWITTQYGLAQAMHACSCHEPMSHPIPFLKHNLNQQKCLKIVFRETTFSTYLVAKKKKKKLKWQSMAWGFMAMN